IGAGVGSWPASSTAGSTGERCSNKNEKKVTSSNTGTTCSRRLRIILRRSPLIITKLPDQRGENDTLQSGHRPTVETPAPFPHRPAAQSDNGFGTGIPRAARQDLGSHPAARCAAPSACASAARRALQTAAPACRGARHADE